MRQADGLFLACARKVAEDYPDITFEDQYLDTVCLRIVQDPNNYGKEVQGLTRSFLSKITLIFEK